MQASQLLRDDPRQKTAECTQSVRQCLRALYACSESLRLSVSGSGATQADAATICSAVNKCLQLHELVRATCGCWIFERGLSSSQVSLRADPLKQRVLQSTAPALKATLGRQPEAWPNVRNALLSVARGAVEQLVEICQQQAGPLQRDLQQA